MDARINRALQLLDKSKQVAASSRAKARAFAERQAKAREEAEAHLAAGLPVPSPIKHHPPPTDDAAPTRPAGRCWERWSLMRCGVLTSCSREMISIPSGSDPL